MRIKFLLSFLILQFLLNSVFAVSTKPTKLLEYKNQRGSILILKLIKMKANYGIVKGKFKTAVASKGCGSSIIGKWRPINGFYVGNSIAYSIAYPGCGASTIAITGNFDHKGNLHTLYILANQSKDVNRKNWDTRLIGQDNYQRIKK